MKQAWKKIMQITNVNKRFTTSPTVIKHEKHIDNRENFIRSVVKSLKVKFLHPVKRSMRMLLFKMRNLRGLKNDIFDKQSRGFFHSSAFRSSHPGLFYEKAALNNFDKMHRKTPVSESFFNKVASLTLLKTDSSTLVFQ